ncbi:hypothetical protein JA33_076 [Dickeya phage vB_DsoM_JA33]|uniref:Uncharacterized protein n=3 Tax=Salmondvirus JA11 TaxID=2734141 RepID=A0A384ZW57_9CAUD|nr:hypothetical protein HOU32_gp076 [Dickeya phage vB_DsoM_JA11]AXG66480.1 hypothetical protein JA13_077 [Dickeya phage vB_DsoM_JA13]AXG67450.1 hypothetical protein JA33_076 [Dickeya phage vB_DsoM_JA33]AYD79881.1 hypothetical protein JA11_076 [Dickeya phage vB_DsoM_JA11]
MIVSKALRNIRQKIDWTAATSSNTAVGIWFYGSGAFEARDERLDNDSTINSDTNFIAVTGGSISDSDWHNILATYGDAPTVTQIRAWLTANRTDLVTVLHTSVAGCCRIELMNDGRYMAMDFTLGTPLASSNFTTLIACMQNTSSSTVNASQPCYNFFELSFTDFLNMGVPLVNNGDGTYKINFAVERLRMKISEDV